MVIRALVLLFALFILWHVWLCLLAKIDSSMIELESCVNCWSVAVWENLVTVGGDQQANVGSKCGCYLFDKSCASCF